MFTIIIEVIVIANDEIKLNIEKRSIYFYVYIFD
jgi:hypothetical protein